MGSPRSKLLRSKFKELKENEKVLDNFACAAKTSILLQGMIYVTNNAVYFYSPFNEKTLIGYGTKIKIEFDTISDMHKERSMMIFENIIKYKFYFQCFS